MFDGIEYGSVWWTKQNFQIPFFNYTPVAVLLWKATFSMSMYFMLLEIFKEFKKSPNLSVVMLSFRVCQPKPPLFVIAIAKEYF